MSYNRQGYWDDGVKRECTNCSIIFTKTSKAVTLCPACNTERVKSATPEYKMWARAKVRCEKNGREFSLSQDDIVIPKFCPILGFPLVVHKGKPGAYRDSPSLDRVDNDKGYTPDNVQVISQCANQMKGAASKIDLLAFAEWIRSTYENS